MAKWLVYGTVVGSKYIGEVEADTEEEAKKKGWQLDETYISLCHQCCSECEDPEVSKITVEEDIHHG